MRKGKAENIPYSVSRDTDVPAFYLPWFIERMQIGHIVAALPGDLTPSMWSLAPEDTHSIIWWSRNYEHLLKEVERFQPYRMVFNMTILGFDPHTNQKVMPHWRDQIEQATELIRLFGPEAFRWRLSPLPDKLRENDVLRCIIEDLSRLGVKDCFASFMHPNPVIQDERLEAEKLSEVGALKRMLDEHKMTLRMCGLDSRYVDWRIAEQATCVDPIGGKLDRCGCALTVNFGNHLEIPCKMGCRYCYASGFHMQRKAPDNA